MNYSKDGITVAPVIDTSHPKQNGLFPIRIRVTFVRQRKYYPTGKDLTIEEWESMPSAKSRRIADIRKDIENSYNLVREAVENLASLGNFSFDALNSRLKGAACDTINAAFVSKIKELGSQDKEGTMRVYRVVLKGIERFGGDKITFNTISEDWLKRYDRFLRGESKSNTTIGIHMRHIRAIINEAKRNGILKEAQYPFGRGRFEIQAGEGRKMALTIKQIGEIASYKTNNELTVKYRDYWLFLYMCNGINVADFVKLKYKDIVNGEICFVRQKTENTTKTKKEIRVVVSDPMSKIINRWGNIAQNNNYIFPILDGTESTSQRKDKTLNAAWAINKRMKLIGKELGIGNITTYTARHSFATILKRAGVKISYISESLGHNDIKTTESYLSSFEREEREKNAAFLTDF